jgi:muramoyltetrapeptide carboxypeptidase LdcA involved in peptidoglycan recycling
VRAIFCTIGGDHSNQLLSSLDFELVRENPKPLIGFSDITVLQLALLARARLITFYGPTVLTGLAEHPRPFPYTIDHLRRALFSARPLGEMVASAAWTDEYLEWSLKADLTRARRIRPNSGPRTLRGGAATGRLIGGCLPSILFWEIPEGGYGPPEVDSHLTDLELVGVFDRIGGMIVGRPYQYTARMRAELDAVILERTARYPFPILIDLDFGHTDPVFTLPIGAVAEIDADRRSLTILEAGCAEG